MYRRPAAILLCTAVLCAAGAMAVAAPGDPPARAFWISPAALESEDALRRAVAAAVAAATDTLLVPIPLDPVLPDGGDAARAGFDGIGEAIREGRERGLRVHAWIDVTLAARANDLPASRDHVIYRHPDWLMVPREIATEMLAIDVRNPEYLGRLARWTRARAPRVEGLYLSPLHQEAAAALAASVRALVQRYPVDGIHLDTVRFPGSDFDYSRFALERFRTTIRSGLAAAERTRIDIVETIDPYAYVEELPGEWQRFRQSQLTALVTRLAAAARAVKSTLVVTATVTPDAEAAMRDHLQDWRTWMDIGSIDGLAQRTGNTGTILSTYDSLIGPPAGALPAVVPTTGVGGAR